MERNDEPVATRVLVIGILTRLYQMRARSATAIGDARPDREAIRSLLGPLPAPARRD